MAKTFIITSFKNGDMYEKLREELLNRGHTLTHDWYAHCKGKKERTVAEVRANLDLDLSALCEADCAILLLPCGNDSFVELGYALGIGVLVLVAGEAVWPEWQQHDPLNLCSYFAHDRLALNAYGNTDVSAIVGHFEDTVDLWRNW